MPYFKAPVSFKISLAAIGGIALSLGLPCGNIILSVAVLGILITAPLGAILMDAMKKKLLSIEQ